MSRQGGVLRVLRAAAWLLAAAGGIGASALAGSPAPSAPPVAIRAGVVHTAVGAPIVDGVVLVKDGRITAVGPAATTPIPAGWKVLEAAVAIPGLVDMRATVGVSGLFNTPQDSDQLERSAPLQPELRALDAFNPRDRLVAWVRSFGTTTVNTGNAPGELVSGQTFVVKLDGRGADAAALVETSAIVATLGPGAIKDGAKSPGTRGKQVAMLRAELVKAREYRARRAAAKPEAPVALDLRLESLARVLDGSVPLLVTAQRAQDIDSALRLKQEFGLKLWLDGAAEAYLLADRIKAADVPVVVHPTMTRAFGELENLALDNAARLRAAGVRVVFSTGFEDYVPKARVLLFEVAVAAAAGRLTLEEVLPMATIEPARLLGLESRIGSLEVGKDADIALFDGDPLEYTTHCLATLINGRW